ncbi:TonB-dependent receptor domain-containing protein [Rhodothalassium salexigens]|uniref:TonB-dependent receptor domain-containing protein n=1 Tax=Rhodothalassium salexigens TaxID=1086 RepID=UPI001A9145D4|nr:TonB-dependent receptor [Rhodothalassium salexigens]
MTDGLIKRTALFGTSAVALLCATAGATAQAANDQQDATLEVEEIVVTGSRLANTNISSPVPVVQIGSEQIDSRGAVRIEEVLNVLPSAFGAQTSSAVNGATGTSTVDLRGLGAVRTLPLIDGKRLPFGSDSSAAANLDIVPTQLIERVDVVTGGASAIYGSDAVAGVVNFVLKDDFEGIEFDGQVGFHHSGNSNSFMENVTAAAGFPDAESTADGRDVFATLTVGANSPDGRGNITAHVAYQNQNAILQGDRDISACAIGSNDGPLGFGGIGCVGSSNFRRFNTDLGALFQQEDGTLVPLVGGPAQTYNFGPLNYFQRPNERFNLYTRGHYDITDNMEVFMDLSFMNNNTAAQIAPSASFNRPFQINCDNPLLQNGLGPNGEGVATFFDALGCGAIIEAFENGERDNVDRAFFNSHRNVEGDPRVSELDNTNWRIVTGFRGELFDNFQWETFGQFSRVKTQDISRNDLNFDRVQQALFVVDGPNGQPICDPARNPDAGCVPWNILGRTADGQSLVTQDAVDFVQGVGITVGETNQRVVGGTIQGDFGRYGLTSPFAEDGVSALAGFEYRKDELERIPDDVSQIPGGRGLTGVGGGTLPVSGQVEVFELFMETQIPIVQDAPLIRELSLSGAYRRSQYSTKGDDPITGNPTSNDFGTNTFFVGTNYAPVDDIRFRVQFQRAIRAPNVFNLFLTQNTGLVDLATGPNGLFDPCAGTTDPTDSIPSPSASLAQCQNTGVSAAQYGTIEDNPAGQYNIVTSGNADLEAEVSDTFTVGTVWTPSYLPGFSLAVDYFNITIDGAIATIPAQTTLDRCIANGDERFCSLIQRDQFGTLWLDNSNFEGIRTPLDNIAQLKTTGVDFSAKYSFDLEAIGLGNAGTLNLDYNATWLRSNSFTPIEGTDEVECQGLYRGGCGVPNPEYRHIFLANWQTPWDVGVTATWRYFGDVELNGTSGNPVDAVLETRNYLDLVVRWQATDFAEFRLGANNLLNNQAPITTSAGTAPGNGNTFPASYDVDRFIFFGVNFRY